MPPISLASPIYFDNIFKINKIAISIKIKRFTKVDVFYARQRNIRNSP